jgi:hypothetical protein
MPTRLARLSQQQADLLQRMTQVRRETDQQITLTQAMLRAFRQPKA